MQTKTFHLEPYQDPKEWDALKQSLFMHAEESCNRAVYYQQNNGKIVEQNQLTRLFNSKTDFKVYLPAKFIEKMHLMYRNNLGVMGSGTK